MIRMSTRTRVSAGALVAVLAISGGALAAASSASSSTNVSSSNSSTVQPHDHQALADFQAAMRTLWSQHMEWTWSTVVAFASDSPSLHADLDRLLRNQQDIGDAIAPYYGKDAAQQLADLLTTHINQAVPVLVAAKAGDQKALKRALKDWYANAKDIADFLAKANPDNWPKQALRDMLKGHIDQTTAYASDIIGGHYVDAIVEYDEAEAHMMHLSDTLARGIIAQFPEKF
jgi:hypothetical protein